jgi:hypothetical protein
MAARRKFTSLRGRFAWTLAVAASISLVSLVSIVLYRARKPIEQPGAESLVTTESQAADENAAPLVAPSAKFGVVQAVAVEGNNNGPRLGNFDRAVQPAGGEFVEQTPGSVPASNFHSSRYGYSLMLNGTAWTRWDDLSQVVPEAECGALLNNYGRLLVMPVLLADLTASPAEIDRALLAEFGFEYPEQRLPESENIVRQGSEGHAFRLTRTISGRENMYRIWILHRDHVAFLVAAWIDRTAALNSMTAAVDGNQVKAPAVVPSQLDAEINAQLEDALGHFKLDEAAATVGEQSPLSQHHVLHRASHLHPQPAAIEN